LAVAEFPEASKAVLVAGDRLRIDLPSKSATSWDAYVHRGSRSVDWQVNVVLDALECSGFTSRSASGVGFGTDGVAGMVSG